MDDSTVRITLTKRDASFLSSLGMDFTSIYSAEYADKMMKAGIPEAVDTTPIGTGPFVFSGYVLDQASRYVANKEYWKGKPDIDRLIFWDRAGCNNPLCEITIRSMWFNGLPKCNRHWENENDPKINLLSQPGLNIAYVAFNTEKAPFDNVKVRQALNLAVDKKRLLM